MDDRNRAPPIALPRNAPIAQPLIHLPLGDRPVVAALLLQTARYFFLGPRARHAVEKARIDHRAVALIGCIGNDELLRINTGRADYRHIAEAVFVDEIEVALVVRGAAEDGAGAVFHDDEIGDVDGQLPRCVERVARANAGIEAELLGGLDLSLRRAAMPALLDEFGQ